MKKIDVKDGNDTRILVQIVDVTDKMMYDEVNAEKNFQIVINGAISEDFRNPLDDLKKGIETISHSALKTINQLFQILAKQQDVK